MYQVFFAGHEIERPGLCVVPHDKVKQGVEFLLVFCFCHFCDGLAVVFLEFRIHHAGNQNSRPSPAVLVKVFPIRVIGSHFIFDSRPDIGVVKALKKLFNTAVGNPRRERGR